MVSFVCITLCLAIAMLPARCHALYSNISGSDLDPENWRLSYPKCGGLNQSPININTSSTSKKTAVLTFSGYNTTQCQNYTMLDTGHTAQVNVNSKTIKLTSSLLNGTYVLEQYHFHWGNFEFNGSEHSINQQLHPLELHLVHYNSDKYNNVSHAASSNDSDSLFVLGIFCDVAPPGVTPSKAFDSFVNYLDNIKYKGDKTDFPAFPIESLLPCEESTVYTYSGSLTSPPCVENVNWNFLAKAIYLSDSYLIELENKFRQLHGENPTEFITHNNRPIQLLNSRVVYEYNIQSPCSMQAPSTGPTVATSLLTTTSGVSTPHSIKKLTNKLLKLALVTQIFLSIQQKLLI